MQDVNIINPLDINDWNKQILNFTDSTVFHSLEWGRTITETYKFKPYYFVHFDGTRLTTVLPIMETQNLFGRKKGICFPFSDFCHPLYTTKSDFQTMFVFVQQTALAKKWHSIVIRGNAPFENNVTIATSYNRHILTLKNDPESLFRKFRDTTRHHIRRASEKGVTVSFENSIEAMHTFYSLNCLTRKRHGLPPQPISFFKNLQKFFLSAGKGTIALAKYRDNTVAAAIFLQFGTSAYYKYGASDPQFKHTYANYAIMWEAIRKYCWSGFKELCFGRTELQHKGLLQFKNGWATQQININNYEYISRKACFRKSKLKTNGIHNVIFAHIPVCLSKVISNLLYRYLY